MTTVDPDTLERDSEVLRDIGRRFRGRLALNADVARPGAIAIGDPATSTSTTCSEASDAPGLGLVMPRRASHEYSS